MKNILLFAVLFFLGCNQEQPKSPEPPVSQNSGVAQSDSLPVFLSNDGGYEIPLRYSTAAAVAGIGDPKDFIREHSVEGLWTYIMQPMNMVNSQTGKIELPKVGVDSFSIFYGDKLVGVFIKWAPITSDVKQELQQAQALLQKDVISSDGPETELVIDGHAGLCWNFTTDAGAKMHDTFILVHSDKKRYEILLTYPVGFSDPGNTFDKIKAIKFK